MLQFDAKSTAISAREDTRTASELTAVVFSFPRSTYRSTKHLPARIESVRFRDVVSPTFRREIESALGALDTLRENRRSAPIVRELRSFAAALDSTFNTEIKA